MIHRHLLLVCCLGLVSCSATVAQQQQQQHLLDNARSWYQHGDLLSAEQQLHRLHQRDLATAESWRLLGNIQFRQQRMQAAKQAYQQALALAPTDADSWHNLALTQLRLTTSVLMSARTQLGQLTAEDARLLDTLLRLQRVKLP